MKSKHYFVALMLIFGTTVVSAQNVSQLGQRSDRKILEISKAVKLTPSQEASIRIAYDSYNAKVDSALYEVNDAKEAAKIKYDAGKKFNFVLMNVLTEQQRNEYISVMSCPEVEAKTEYKLGLLRETGEYSEEELQQKRKAIYNYLMSEKIVYARDKYDIKKQKENISRLKNLLPQALKESNIREKVKGIGKVVNGKIIW